VLGRGSFAVVYAAEHVALRRQVAIKVLHLTPDTGRPIIQRFQREAKTAALVRHPNVLAMYDSGTLGDGSLYLVFERAHGGTLAAALTRGPLAMDVALDIGRQLARGLCAIGEAGIIHRDLKPANVMLHLDPEGAPLVKIVDFGVSKRVAPQPVVLTRQGELIGTPQYMSPEQLRGEEIDARSDVYALGALLYEAITASPPHERKNLGDLMVAVLQERVRPPRELRPDCPAALEHIVMKALARDRAQRFDAAGLLQALEQVILPAPAREEQTARRPATVAEPPRGEVYVDAAAPVRPFAHALPSASVDVTGDEQRPRAHAPRRLWLAAALLAAVLGAAVAVGAFKRPATPTEHAALPRAVRVEAPGASAPAAAPAPAALPADAQSEGSQASAQQPTQASPPVRSAELRARRQTPQSAIVPAARRELPKAPKPAISRPPTAAQGPLAPARAQPERARTDVVESAAGKAGSAVGPAASVRAAREEPEPPTATPAASDGDWQSKMREAFAALAAGNAESARALYREAVKLAPAQAAGYRGLALAAARAGDRHEAERALARYLELAPGAKDGPTIAARVAASASAR
jgi:serine/threonine-protein kinase